MSSTRSISRDAIILSRLVKGNKVGLSPEAARALLQLEFGKEDRDRLHFLSVKAQEGSLLPDEQDEIESYRRVGYFLDLLRSKARLALKNSKS
jgi:hypothetical protein